jgi:CBS domain-containing protein
MLAPGSPVGCHSSLNLLLDLVRLVSPGPSAVHGACHPDAAECGCTMAVGQSPPWHEVCTSLIPEAAAVPAYTTSSCDPTGAASGERAMRPEDTRVRDLMRREVVTIAPNAGIGELMRLLSKHRIGGVPVVDRDGACIGVVSASDIVGMADGEEKRRSGPPPRAAPEEAEEAEGLVEGTGRVGGEGPPSGFFELAAGPLWHFPLPASAFERAPHFERIPVREIMMPATFRVREEATAVELARFLTRAGIHRALVMDGPILRGIVTTTDLVRLVAGEPESSRR